MKKSANQPPAQVRPTTSTLPPFDPLSLNDERTRGAFTSLAVGPLTLAITLKFPADDWIRFHRFARAKGRTIEEEIREYIVSDEVMNFFPEEGGGK